MKRLLKLSEHPMIATLIATFILSIGYGAFVEKLGEWWTTAKSILLYVWNFVVSIFTFEVAIWQIVLFFAVLVGILFVIAMWQDNKEKNINGRETTEGEKKVLKVFENNYGRTLDIENIARRLGTSDMLLVEAVVKDLIENKSFLIAHYNIMYATTYELTDLGKNYILRNRDSTNN